MQTAFHSVSMLPDSRFHCIGVVFTNHEEEIDVISGEVAKNDEASKVTTDECPYSKE
jgi:hypothetical protein